MTPPMPLDPEGQRRAERDRLILMGAVFLILVLVAILVWQMTHGGGGGGVAPPGYR